MTVDAKAPDANFSAGSSQPTTTKAVDPPCGCGGVTAIEKSSDLPAWRSGNVHATSVCDESRRVVSRQSAPLAPTSFEPPARCAVAVNRRVSVADGLATVTPKIMSPFASSSVGGVIVVRSRALAAIGERCDSVTGCAPPPYVSVAVASTIPPAAPGVTTTRGSHSWFTGSTSRRQSTVLASTLLQNSGGAIVTSPSNVQRRRTSLAGPPPTFTALPA